MTTLRVVLDPVFDSVGDPLGLYAAAITRALIESAPRDCDVAGIGSAASAEDYAVVDAALPGLTSIDKTSLPPRELAVAWQLGVVGTVGTGLIHSPSLLAPLRKHNREDGTQVTVTVHDLTAWTDPAAVGASAVLWQKTMLKRARKHADAVIVPSHSLAERLAEIADFGDRIRVIPGAGRSSMALPGDADRRAAALGLPDAFLLTETTSRTTDGIPVLADGLARSADLDLPLLVFGPAPDVPTPAPTPAAAAAPASPDSPEVAAEPPAAEDAGEVVFLGRLSDDDRAVVLSRAAAFIAPGIDDSLSASIIDALRFGIPVVHADTPAYVELVQDAGVVVARDDSADYADRLAAAIASVVQDASAVTRFGIVGPDRARAFSWRDAAERIWQLHADL